MIELITTSGASVACEMGIEPSVMELTTSGTLVSCDTGRMLPPMTELTMVSGAPVT